MTDDSLKPVADIVLGAIEGAEDARRVEASTAVVSLAEKRGARAKRSSRQKALGDAGDEGPRSWGFSADELNERYALVLMGSKAVVFLIQPGAPIKDQQRVLSLGAFEAWFANKFTEVADRKGAVKVITWSTAWLRSPQRRSYAGVEFFPDPNMAEGTPGFLNLWSGFAVKPRAKPNGYKTFRDHLLNNACAGDDKLFAWAFGFFAHIVQCPRERIGVAIVFRGRMGSGKTKIGEIFGRMFPRHYFLVDDPRYVTGQFNAHMASCLLLQADEAVWAGDKAAEGRLKGLVTSPIQQIEAKGIDPIPLDNFVRLIMTSNEAWVVPAGKDERRFCVLDVDPRCASNHEYFAEMDAELADGGLEALLHDLLAFDLDAVPLRTIPKTKALLEQKERSLQSVDVWWLERLDAGATTRPDRMWRAEIPCDELFDDYIKAAEKIGIKRKREATIFGMELRKLVPGIDKRKITAEVRGEHGVPENRRVNCYILPPLAACRAAWDDAMGQAREWIDDNFAERESDEGRENGENTF